MLQTQRNLDLIRISLHSLAFVLEIRWGWEGEVGSEVETCIIDGEEPEYMHEDPDTWMFDTLDACCETHFW